MADSSSSGESDDKGAVAVGAETAAPTPPASPPTVPAAANDHMAHLKSVYQQHRNTAQQQQQQQLWSGQQQQSQQTQPPPQQQTPPPRPPPPQPQFNPSQQRQTPGRTTTCGVPDHDPLAPTPLDCIKKRHYQTMQEEQQLQQIQQIPPQQQYHRCASQTPRPMQQQQQPHFMFIRVLIKYLEQKDPRLHQQAKLIIMDCDENYKIQNESGCESVTAALMERLKNLVGDHYWKRGEVHFNRYLQKKITGTVVTGGVPPGAQKPLSTSTAATEAARNSTTLPQASQHQQQDLQSKLQLAKPQPPIPQPSTGAPPTIQQVQCEIATQNAKVAAKMTKGNLVAKKQVKHKHSITVPMNQPSMATIRTSPLAAGVLSVSTHASSSSSAMVSLDPEALSAPPEDDAWIQWVDDVLDFDWTTPAALDRELLLRRRQKESRFFMFTRVLIKYLEHKDPSLHQQVKLIIMMDCENNKFQNEFGYESVTAAWKERLKNLVGDHYWKRAEVHFNRYLQKKSAAATEASHGARPAIPPGEGALHFSTSAVAADAARRTTRPPQAWQQQQQHQDDPQSNLQMAQPQPTPVPSTDPPTIQQVHCEIATQNAKVAAKKGMGALVAKKPFKHKPSITSQTNQPMMVTVTASPVATAPSVSTDSSSSSALVPLDPKVLPPPDDDALIDMVDVTMDFVGLQQAFCWDLEWIYNSPNNDTSCC